MSELRKIYTVKRPYLKDTLSLSPRPRAQVAPLSHILTENSLIKGTEKGVNGSVRDKESISGRKNVPWRKDLAVKPTKKDHWAKVRGTAWKTGSGLSDVDHVALETISLEEDSFADVHWRQDVAKYNQKYGIKTATAPRQKAFKWGYGPPHVLLTIAVLLGLVFMFCSVGSSRWMTADVSGLRVTYGLFEACVRNVTFDLTLCNDFDWPAWHSTGSERAKMYAVKCLSMIGVCLAALFLLAWLTLVLASYHPRCYCLSRRTAVVVVDLLLWLLVICSGVSSLLFLTNFDTLQAYPQSSLSWPPILFCVGWVLVLVARLVVAAFCHLHEAEVPESGAATARPAPAAWDSQPLSGLADCPSSGAGVMSATFRPATSSFRALDLVRGL